MTRTRFWHSVIAAGPTAKRLAKWMGGRGAVSFANGFGETEDVGDTNARLLVASRDMPIRHDGGRRFDTKETLKWGHINHAYPSGDLMKMTWDMARLLASGPPFVCATIKGILRYAEDAKFQDRMNRTTKRQRDSLARLYFSEKQIEGACAFSEKRDPVWKGR